ncbi:MAG: GNAT family N-acetyltransferase [Cytophagales bacterium]|nr:GNAT family N-acetyltransferase [Rhizobacter sp.]
MLTVHDEVPREDAEVVDVGLGAFNNAFAPLGDSRGFAVMAHMPEGPLVGGAVGRSWGTCCELQQIWVDEAQRRQGVGGRLLLAFEQRARERGCRTVYLETFSFQAPSFYQLHGYEVALQISGFTGEAIKYTLIKLLDAVVPARASGAEPRAER